MQVLPPWRVVRVLVDRALVKWDNPATALLAVSPGSLSNPWLEPRLHLEGRCLVALVHQEQIQQQVHLLLMVPMVELEHLHLIQVHQ